MNAEDPFLLMVRVGSDHRSILIIVTKDVHRVEELTGLPCLLPKTRQILFPGNGVYNTARNFLCCKYTQGVKCKALLQSSSTKALGFGRKHKIRPNLDSLLITKYNWEEKTRVKRV